MTTTNFDSYIIDNEINKQNLLLLVRKFQKETFVPFIGAGCSVPLGEPDWKDLFKKLKIKYKIKVNLKKNKDSLIDFPKLFSRIYNKIPNNNNFYKDIFENLKPTVTTGTFMHMYLVKAFASYLTTNYDTPVEEAYRLHKELELKKYYLFCPEPENNFNNCIVYLHGHKNIDFVIIKEEDYKYFYPSVSGIAGIPVLENFLKYILQKKNVIFVGSSFSDEYVISFLKYLSRKTDINEHFLLIDDSADIYQNNARISEEYRKKNELKKAQSQKNEFYSSFKSKFNIYPVVYRAKLPVFIQYLFELFSQRGAAVELEEKPISGKPER